MANAKSLENISEQWDNWDLSNCHTFGITSKPIPLMRKQTNPLNESQDKPEQQILKRNTCVK